jgi:hypothetical protein
MQMLEVMSPDNDEGKTFFLDALVGTGKTFFKH